MNTSLLSNGPDDGIDIKSHRLEAARRFCDLMEEDEEVTIAESVAACRELAGWLESTSDEEVILAALDCFSLLLERLNDAYRPLLTLTVGPLLTTLGQPTSKIRLAAITLLTNLVEVHTVREVFELSMNGFLHEDFRIREGCCLLVLSVLKRLGSQSGIKDLVMGDNPLLTAPLVQLAAADPANNCRAAATAAICELLKFCGSKSRGHFDGCDGATEATLAERMNQICGQLRKTENVEPQSGEWLNGIARVDINADSFYEKIDSIRESLDDAQSDNEERCRALRLLRSTLYSNAEDYVENIWGEIAFIPFALSAILKPRRLTKTVREACLTIQHICSLPNAPPSLVEDPLVYLFHLLPKLNESGPTTDAVWCALKMSVRKYQHPKTLRLILKTNPATNHQLKELNTPLMRRRIMTLLESILTLWEDARALRKQKAGLVEAIHRGIYDQDGETRQCARRAWHGLHSRFPAEAGDLLRSLTAAQQNLILGKVAESRAPSRGGSRSNSPGRGNANTSSRRNNMYTGGKAGYSQPVSRSGSPGRNRNRSGSTTQTNVTGGRSASGQRPVSKSVLHSREVSPTRGGSRTGGRFNTIGGRGARSRDTSPTGAASSQSDRTQQIIKLFTSTAMNEKKAGLSGLKRLLEKQVPFRTPELQKLLNGFKALLAGRGPLLLNCLEVLSTFLSVCGPVLDYPWCNFLVPSLTLRASDASLPGQSLAAVFRARTAAVENLAPSLQLQALSKVITSEADISGPRTRVQILVWTTSLAPRLEGNELQLADVRLAIGRIAQWGGELTRNNRIASKSAQYRSQWNVKSIRKCAHETLFAISKSCPAEFETLLDSMPPTTAETARALLVASQNASKVASRATSRGGSRKASPDRNASPRGPSSGRPKSATGTTPNGGFNRPQPVTAPKPYGSLDRRAQNNARNATKKSKIPGPATKNPGPNSPGNIPRVIRRTPQSPNTRVKFPITKSPNSIEQPTFKEPNSEDISEKLSSLDLNLRSPGTRSCEPANGTPGATDERPPPSPCGSDEQSSHNLSESPINVFIDSTRSPVDRLVALESIEPELLDEAEIGRMLLSIQHCIEENIEPTLQLRSFEILSQLSEVRSEYFRNFASPLLTSVMKLSLIEELEMQASDCLSTLLARLPPISLVEPICAAATQVTDTELRSAALNAALKLPKRFKDQIEKDINIGSDGDCYRDISSMSFWPKISVPALSAAQSTLSTVRKMGCALLSTMAVNTQNEKAIDHLLTKLPDTSRRLAAAYIKKAVVK